MKLTHEPISASDQILDRFLRHHYGISVDEL